MEKILSIVIPTYNAEKFLDKGLPTYILDDKEKMKKLEVLVVNDGTPDNSVAVAQKYVEQYPDSKSGVQELAYLKSRRYCRCRPWKQKNGMSIEKA